MTQIQVMVVEDNQIVAADINSALKRSGFDVCCLCSKGEEVLPAIQTHHPDVILMDIQLEGEMDGITAAKAVLDTYKTPLIFLTANSDRFTFDQAKQAQPYAYIVKPFDRIDLEHTIELAISRYVQAQQASSQPIAVGQEEDLATPYFLEDRVFVKVKDEFCKIFLRDILWIEADNNYCFIYTATKKFLVTVNLKTLNKRLVHLPFLRVHRSYIVNLTKLDRIGELHISIQGNKIPVSKSYRPELIKRLRMI